MVRKSSNSPSPLSLSRGTLFRKWPPREVEKESPSTSSASASSSESAHLARSTLAVQSVSFLRRFGFPASAAFSSALSVRLQTPRVPRAPRRSVCDRADRRAAPWAAVLAAVPKVGGFCKAPVKKKKCANPIEAGFSIIAACAHQAISTSRQ